VQPLAEQKLYSTFSLLVAKAGVGVATNPETKTTKIAISKVWVFLLGINASSKFRRTPKREAFRLKGFRGRPRFLGGYQYTPNVNRSC
jgi:hypothetical protein